VEDKGVSIMAKKTVITKGDSGPIQDAALREAEASIRKMFGEGASFYLKEFSERKTQVVSTGCMGLDYALGVGGLQLGRMVEIYGPPSTGKTTLALIIAANAQKEFPEKKILYVDAEHAANKDLMSVLGLDENRTAMISLDTAEQNITAAEIMIRSGAFSVAIIDSVAALTPHVQFEATLEDQFIGLHARLIGRMCQSIKTLVSQTSTLLVLINQTRSKIGTYGNNETTTGGAAIPYYADVRIRTDGGAYKSSRIVDPSSGDTIGQKTKFEVVKNKLAPPFRTAEIDLMYGKGFDVVGELISLGVDMGVIDQGGAWFTYKEHKVQGRPGLVRLLTEKPELAIELKADVSGILTRTNEPIIG
jgi:recombination protein RecA